MLLANRKVRNPSYLVSCRHRRVYGKGEVVDLMEDLMMMMFVQRYFNWNWCMIKMKALSWK